MCIDWLFILCVDQIKNNMPLDLGPVSNNSHGYNPLNGKKSRLKLEIFTYGKNCRKPMVKIAEYLW